MVVGKVLSISMPSTMMMMMRKLLMTLLKILVSGNTRGG